MQDVFSKVEAYKAKHPTTAYSVIFKKLKVKPYDYYKQKPAKKTKKAKLLAKTKYKRIVTNDVPTPTAQVTVIMGTPEQIRQVLN